MQFTLLCYYDIFYLYIGLTNTKQHIKIRKEVNKVGTNLYVGNIPWEISEEQLYHLFRDTNKTDQIRVNIEKDKKTGQSRGFAFVEVPDEHIQSIISRMDGYNLLGRKLIVN